MGCVLLWEQEVGGSNPLTPINYFRALAFLLSPVFFGPNSRKGVFTLIFFARNGCGNGEEVAIRWV